jgi:hypothetical protein
LVILSKYLNMCCDQVLRAQLELGQVRQEIDRRIAEKEEEFNNTRYISPPYSYMFKKYNRPGSIF